MGASLQISSTEVEKQFNFDSWIQDNELNDIRDLFRKHDMDSLHNLAMYWGISEPFKNFMSDPELIADHSHLIPIVISAMQNLGAYTSNDIDLDSFIVISEEENMVMQSIKRYISKLEHIENDLNNIKKIYPQSIQNKKNEKLNQIEQTQNKINETFDKIQQSLFIKRKTFLHKLNCIKHNLANTEKKGDNHLILSSFKTLEISKNYLSSKLAECKYKIKSTNTHNVETIKNRKEAIIKIGKEIQQKFNETEKTLNENNKPIQNVIDTNNNNKIMFDFVVNDDSLNELLKRINDFNVFLSDHQNERKMNKDIDPLNEKQLFEHGVCAWRYDSEQMQWKGIGKGQITLYFNKKKNIGKVIFVEDKEHETRLLQYVDGNTYCENSVSMGNGIEWYGADYTMDNKEPMIAKWKITLDEQVAVKEFMQIFNGLIDRYNGYINKVSNNDIFVDDEIIERKQDEEGVSSDPLRNENHDEDYKSWTEKDQMVPNSLNNQLSPKSFAKWKRDNNYDGLTSANGDQRIEDDNKQESDSENYNIDESAHANDDILSKFEILKFHRWNKEMNGWDNGSGKCCLEFHQKGNGKIRLICRDNATNNLRWNQAVASEKIAAIKKVQRQMYWSGVDTATEDKQMCLANFADQEIADNFYKCFVTASENNSSLFK